MWRDYTGVVDRLVVGVVFGVVVDVVGEMETISRGSFVEPVGPVERLQTMGPMWAVCVRSEAALRFIVDYISW